MMFSRSLGGSTELVEIIEFDGPTHDAQWMLPDATPHTLNANAAWLQDRFWAPRTNRLVFTYQLWLLKMSDAIVLIDTGCGNHKDRVSPYQNKINTPVIDWLEAVGAPPEKVTRVLHTHLHPDHVGWNLHGCWMEGGYRRFQTPRTTCPNWTMNYSKTAEREAWVRKCTTVYSLTASFPCFGPALTRFVKDGDEIAGLVATATPGHTPGHVDYTLHHSGNEIIFAGDVLRSPVQVLCPHVNSRWCEDRRLARESRQSLLRRAAASCAAVFPAHARGIHGWRIGLKEDGFSIRVR